METIFEIPDQPKEKPKHTCRTCENRQRWQCGGRVIQYCGVRKSKRTDNGLLRIRVTDAACLAYLPEQKTHNS